jgi:4-amino-4-deoxy-L-arabinose transferase-like glycosyltransferase
MTDRTKRLLIGLILVLPLLGWWLYGLFDLDEGFYAAVTAEMNRTGSWITPLFNGHPWYEKPILLYWLAKPCLALFGLWFGLRLPSILATLATYGIVAWFGNRRLGPNAGTLAALALGTSVLFVGAGRMMLVDPLLVLSLTACFLFFWESLVAEQNRPAWRMASAAALGLSVLAKGPVGGIFFLLLLAFTAWRYPNLRPRLKGAWLPSVAVFAVVVAAWYLPAYLVDGQTFVQKFLVEQNLRRFSGGDEAHAVPAPLGLLYYLPILLVGFLPWSLRLHRVLPDLRPSETQDPRPYLAAWAAIVFLFFTVSTTKLPHYVLPCFPPLAVLVGAGLAVKPLNQPRLTRFLGGAIGLSALANLLFWGYWRSFHAEIQSLALETKADGLPPNVVLFALAKPDHPTQDAPPTPKLFGLIPIRINETSHPSLLAYLNRDVIETDRFEDILNLPIRPGPELRQTLVFTRPGRFPKDAARQATAHGLWLAQLGTNTQQDLYRVYVLQRAR